MAAVAEAGVVRSRFVHGVPHVSALQYVGFVAGPPNKWLQLTRQLGAPLAKRRARAAPSCPAAEPGC